MFDSCNTFETANNVQATQAKTLAKSLHTVTVLVNVARHLEKTQGLGSWAALLEAAIILGLGEMTDSYGLLAQARKKMDRA